MIPLFLWSFVGECRTSLSYERGRGLWIQSAGQADIGQHNLLSPSLPSSVSLSPETTVQCPVHPLAVILLEVFPSIGMQPGINLFATERWRRPRVKKVIIN